MKRFILILLSIQFNIISIHCIAQNKHIIDSIQSLLKVVKYDSTRINLFVKLSEAYYDNNPEEAIRFAKQSLELSKHISYQKGIGNAYNSLGNIYRYKGDFLLAQKYNQEALNVFEKIGDKSGLGMSFICIGNNYNFQGNFSEALKNYLASLRIYESTNYKKGIALAYNNIGNIYEVLGNHNEALKNGLAALKFYKELLDKKGIAGSLNNIGDTYKELGNFTEARNNFFEALKINKEIGNKNWESINLSNLGSIYSIQNNYSLALKYYLDALSISKEIGDSYSMADSYCGIGNTYTLQKKFIEANDYLTKALTLSMEIGSLESIKKSFNGLAKLEYASGNYKLALEYYKFEIAYRDSMFNIESSKKAVQQQMQYDFDKKESLTKAEQEKKDAITKKELQRQKLVRNGFIGGFGIVLLFAGVFFTQRNRIKKGNKELQIAKERAEQSERYEQQFLANMSHEIRTPMNAVMGMTNLLITKSPREDQLNYLEGIKKSSENLLYIINDILDLSKIEAGKIEFEQIDFSLYSVINQVKQTLNHKAEEKGLYLITEIDLDVPDVVIGDPVRLNQILINLAGNAIKFTEKGSVIIEVRCPVSDVRGVNREQLTVNNAAALKFSIIDTGIGIPKDKLQTVFESFKQAHSSDTRKYGGTGLGLSISKQFVELMGGNISIESEEGSGTTFSFIISLPKGSPEKIKALKSAEQIDGTILNGLRILLADDNEYNLTVARDSIKAVAEVTIKEAKNGKEVIELLKENEFDVVLMDVQMPVMDGYEATRYIREHFDLPKNKVPVIALTASVIKSDLDKCREAGMNDYVPKPFMVSQLVTAIAKVTNREIKFTEKKPGIENTKEAINTRITDLSYLRKFCEEDETKMKKYIDIFISTAPIIIEKIQLALSNNDLIEIANQLHGFKTKLIMMGMNEIKDLSISLEIQCRNGISDDNLMSRIKVVILQIQKAINELKES